MNKINLHFEKSFIQQLYTKVDELFNRCDEEKHELDEIRAIRLAGFKKSEFREQIELRRDFEGKIVPKLNDNELENILLEFWKE